MRKCLSSAVLILVALSCVSLFGQNSEANITLRDSLSMPVLEQSPWFTFMLPKPNGDIKFYVRAKADWDSDYYNYTYSYSYDDHQFREANFAGTTPSNEDLDYYPTFYYSVNDERCIMIWVYENSIFINPQYFLRVDVFSDDTAYSEYLYQYQYDEGLWGNQIRYITDDYRLVLSSRDGLFMHDLITGESLSLLDPAYYMDQSLVTKYFLKLEDANYLYLQVPRGSLAMPAQMYVYDLDGEMLAYQELVIPGLPQAWFTAHLLTDDNQLYFVCVMPDSAPQIARISIYDDFSYDIDLYDINIDISNIISFRKISEGLWLAFCLEDTDTGDRYYFSFLEETQEGTMNLIARHEFENMEMLYRWNYSSDMVYWYKDDVTPLQLNYVFTNDLQTLHSQTIDINVLYNTRSYIYGNELRMQSGNKLYFCDINNPISNSDETQTPPPAQIVSYPNPARRSQGFRLETAVKQPLEIGIYNIRGQLVHSVHTDISGVCEVNKEALQHLSTGIYFLKARGQEKIKPRKFILVK